MFEAPAKDIFIYGTGQNAIKFVLKNDINNVHCFIEEKRDISEFFGKPVLNLKNTLQILNGRYIVVASSDDAYFEIKSCLEEEGLKEFEGFIYHELYKKKIACIYGNCHTGPIKEALKQSKCFSEVYGFYPLRQIQIMKQNNTPDYEASVFSYCDLFIHQSIRKNNSYGKEYASESIIKRIPSTSEIIAIPNLYGLPKCFYPQVWGGESKLHEGMNMFPFRDWFLDAYGDINHLDDMVAMIRDENLISSSSIQTAWEEFICRIKNREMEWDIKISDFLLNTYKDEQLFYDPNHPTPVVIKYIAESILHILGFLDLADKNMFGKLECLDTYEIPIYSSVEKALFLNYHKKYYREYSKWKISTVAMDLQEYIKEYMLWNLD